MKEEELKKMDNIEKIILGMRSGGDAKELIINCMHDDIRENVHHFGNWYYSSDWDKTFILEYAEKDPEFEENVMVTGLNYFLLQNCDDY